MKRYNAIVLHGFLRSVLQQLFAGLVINGAEGLRRQFIDFGI